MAFRIVNRTYISDEPESFGLIEGYTSNTVGETYLRMNIYTKITERILSHDKNVFGSIPCDVVEIVETKPHYRERRVGDYIGEGIRLDKRQVTKLIWELLKWLIRGR